MLSQRQSVTNSPIKKIVEVKQPVIAVFKNKKSEEMVYAKFKRDFDQAFLVSKGGRDMSKNRANKVLISLGFVIH